MQRTNTPLLPVTLLALLAGLFLGSCRSAYYATMEQFGVHKRDILVEEVEAGRSDQAEAQEEFISTYDLFKQITGYSGGDLEELYGKLSDGLDDCEDAADDVANRIEDIEDVARDLFEEWSAELAEISNASLRSKSEDMLLETKDRYRELIGAMRSAESKMQPVLVAFSDHVIFLKHNLNARAVASLQDVVLEIEGDVDALIEDMELSIQEADDFLRAMGS